MPPNAGCLSGWHEAGAEEKVVHAIRAHQISRSQLARSPCGTSYSTVARIYECAYEIRHRDDDQGDHAQTYAFMLHSPLVSTQEYLLLSDDDKERGALTSSKLVNSTAQNRDDHRICIWLEDISGLAVG